MKQKIVFAMIMGSITTGIISFTLISINLGFVPQFVYVWLKSWALSYMVAIPAILIISPRVQLLVNYLFQQKIRR